MRAHLLAGMGGFSLGIAFRSLATVSFSYLGFIFILELLVLGVWYWHRRSIYLILFVFMVFTLLGVCRVALVSRSIPDEFVSLVGSRVSLPGTVVADPDIRETTERITIEVWKDTEHTRVLAVTGPASELHYGDRVLLTGSLEYPEAFDTDGRRTFNCPDFLAKDDIFALVEYAKMERVDEKVPFFMLPQRWLYAGKRVFIHALETALPEPAASLAVGLIAGGKQGLGTKLLDAFTASGLLPIVVLSGYNVMIIAEAIMRAFGFLPKRIGIGAAGLIVLLFVLAAGGGASAFRAALMAGLALFARASGRTYDALRVLLFVFVVMLLLNPLALVYDPGFQFSFLATVGLILGTPLLMPRLLFISSAMLREVLASTIAAQVAVLPLLLYQTGNLSLVSVPANLLVLPMVPLAMLLSAIAGLAGLIASPFAPLIGLPAYLALSYVISIAQFSASLPLASFIIPVFPFLPVLCMYLALGLMYVYVKKKTFTTKDANVSPVLRV